MSSRLRSLMLILGGLLAAILAVVCGWVVSLLLADRLLSGTAIEVRLAGGFCLNYWLAAWIFEVLALVGLFRAPVLIPLVIVIPLVVGWRWGSDLRPRLHRIAGETRQEMRGILAELKPHRWLLVGFTVVAIHVGLRMVRTLATPAFGWDDFTYHLFRAGRWVQNSGLVLEPAPDAWTYYEFFPWGGDLIWAWALVWKVGDVLVPVFAIGLWCGVLLGAYALAKELGQRRSSSLIVAAALALLPSQISQISTAYVDNAVLALALATSLFLVTFLKGQDRAGSAFAIGAASGLGLLVKMSFLPLLVPAALIVSWRSLSRRRWGELLAAAAGLSVAVPNLLYNLVHRSSPFYPFEIVSFLPFNEQHSWILSKYGEGATIPELVRAARALVINESPYDPFLNVGFLAALLLVLGVMGSRKLLAETWGRWYLFWAYSGAVITVITFFSPANSSMFVLWTLVMGRFLVPSLVALLTLSGLAGDRLTRGLVFPVLWIEYLFHGRRKWPPEMLLTVLQIVGVLLVLAGLWWLWRRRRRQVPGGAFAVLMGVLAFATLIGVRERFRWDAYQLYSERLLYDFHGVPHTGMWPIWREADRPEGQKIAVTAGFDGQTGHNWFRWPFLGRWLQNEVIYIPVTRDGELVSYREPETLIQVADFESWLQRIADQEVDLVAALGPANIEHRWIRDHPDIFVLEATMANDNFLLARVDRGALAAYLARSR